MFDNIAHILLKVKEILGRDEKCPSLPYTIRVRALVGLRMSSSSMSQ